jgi:UDP-glucose 4-epimerase
MNIFITGGLGFIGSHVCVQLLNVGHKIILIDDLSNSKADVLAKIKSLSNNNIKLYQDTILNKKLLENIFVENKIDLVIHFAGLKSVSESIRYPLKYYDINVNGTINLLQIMKKYNCFTPLHI